MAVLQAISSDMGLEKAIEHGKEHRKPFGKFSGNYTKSIDMSCRNHGGCPRSLSNFALCTITGSPL